MSENSKLLNIEYLQEISGGDTSFCHEILEIFISRIPEDLKELHKFVHNELFDDVAFKAHAMRSAMSSMRAEKCREILTELEKAARAQEKQIVEETFLEVRRLCIEAVDEAKNWILANPTS